MLRRGEGRGGEARKQGWRAGGPCRRTRAGSRVRLLLCTQEDTVGGLVEERFPHPHPCQQKAQENRQNNRAFRHCTI